MINYEDMTMKELVNIYNKYTDKPVKAFNNKIIAIEKVKELKTLYSSHPYKSDKVIEEREVKVPEKKPDYLTPKQVEVELNLTAPIIRKRLRKLFPEMAKQGSWKITPEMVERIKNGN